MRARPSSRWLSPSLAALLLCLGASPALAYVSETSPRAFHSSDAQNRTGGLNSVPGIPVEVRCLVRADAHRAISVCTYEIASDPIETKYVHADGLGSIRKLTDESGAVTDSYTYNAFGELLEHVGSDPQPYMFAGEAWEGGTGLYYNRARWLDVGTGRFVSEDPVTENRPYLYAENDPILLIDPSGEDVAGTDWSYFLQNFGFGAAPRGKSGGATSGGSLRFGSGKPPMPGWVSVGEAFPDDAGVAQAEIERAAWATQTALSTKGASTAMRLARKHEQEWTRAKLGSLFEQTEMWIRGPIPGVESGEKYVEGQAAEPLGQVPYRISVAKYYRTQKLLEAQEFLKRAILHEWAHHIFLLGRKYEHPDVRDLDTWSDDPAYILEKACYGLPWYLK